MTTGSKGRAAARGSERRHEENARLREVLKQTREALSGVQFMSTRDRSDGTRYVMRRHTWGFSETTLRLRNINGKLRWDTISHVEHRVPTTAEVSDAAELKRLHEDNQSLRAALADERTKSAYWAQRAHDLEQAEIREHAPKRDAMRAALEDARAFLSRHTEEDFEPAQRLRQTINKALK